MRVAFNEMFNKRDLLNLFYNACFEPSLNSIHGKTSETIMKNLIENYLVNKHLVQLNKILIN